MSEKAVLLEKKDRIATITLNRPEAMNSMNRELVDELIEALNDVKNDKDVRVVVLTGNGKGFCAGGDLFYLLTLKGPVAARTFANEVGGMVATIMGMEKPVIAMINGVAAGAGFNLALACDLLICAKSVRFTQSFAKVGLVPDCGGFYLLPRVVGAHKAKELMFTADVINSETALGLGIVNKVVEDAALADSVYELAKRLADGPPIALGIIKSMVNRANNLDLESTLEYEADLQAICIQTADHKEGVEAFKAKRAPVFHGI